MLNMMFFGRLAAEVKPKMLNSINRFLTAGIIGISKCFQNYSDDPRKTPENKPDDLTPKSVFKKVIEDFSKPSQPEEMPFFGCCRYMGLAGKVALIPGGTRGIGLAVAKDLIENGATRVIITGRDVKSGAAALKNLKNLITSNSIDYCQQAVYVPMDVSSEEGLKDLFEYTASAGGFDILVNAAAIMNESSMWRRMIDINLRALIDCTRFGVDSMLKSKKTGGVVVNLSAIYAFKPLPQMPIFSATKAAVRNATIGFSRVNNNCGLRIMTACMGPTDTPMLLNLSPGDIGEWAEEEQEDLLDMLKAKQNVENAARCITKMMEYADNGSTYLVVNNKLHRSKNDKGPMFSKIMVQKFTAE